MKIHSLLQGSPRLECPLSQLHVWGGGERGSTLPPSIFPKLAWSRLLWPALLWIEAAKYELYNFLDSTQELYAFLFAFKFALHNINRGKVKFMLISENFNFS